MIKTKIDNTEVTVPEGSTVLDAALKSGIYIPHLCAHPALPVIESLQPAKFIYRGNQCLNNKGAGLYEGCQLCMINIAGKEGLQRACNTVISEGMVILTNTSEAQEYRRNRLMFILTKHPHACLMCAQREGCARFPCSTNVPEKERCCVHFGNCELQKIAEYVGIKSETPRYIYENIPIFEEPLFSRNYNLCIGCLRCVRACRELRGVKAIDFVLDTEGRPIVGTVSPDLKESACRFCTACVEVCPTGALLDRQEYKEAPCRVTCPAGIDVPLYIQLISTGKFTAAAAVIREKVPLPTILGYICPHECEIKCRRTEINDAVGIRALKRFAAEHDDKSWKKQLIKAPATGKKIAVVGSGPAGLSAAYYLNLMGHTVTIFEAAAKAGGMMRTAIPRFLLPESVLDEDINEILSLGIELKLNNPVTNVKDLLQEGYNAVMIGIGLPEGRKLPIPGKDLEGVLTGVEFLRDVSEVKPVNLGNNILVLGGGGVACDVARTAKRLGVKQVAMAYLESKETMPAPKHDMHQTEDEGIIFYPSCTFKQIVGENGSIKGVQCDRVKWMKFDDEGKLQMETIPDSTHVIPADTVIFAIGQGIDRRLAESSGIELTKRGIIRANDTLQTNLPGVFASGDVVSGPASVVEAIATGRKAADSIDKYLGGKGWAEQKLSQERQYPAYLGREEAFADKARINADLLPQAEHTKTFTAFECTLTTDQANAEASRCLKCDLRFQIAKPVLPPKKKLWVEFNAENISHVPEIEGVFQLLDEQENIIFIKGAINMRKELEGQLESSQKARYFMYEQVPMYTKKESELLQQYLVEYGEMPEGNRELDDLF